MRICFLEGDMSRTGGTERMTAWLANQLCTSHQVSVLSLHLSGTDVFFPLDAAVTHQVLPAFSGKTGILKQIRWIHNYIKENHIDRVINVDMGMGFYGILAAKGTSVKTITWEHGNFFNNWGSRLFPYMRRFAARHSDAVVVLTQRDKENYEASIALCRPVHVIHNPVQKHASEYNCESKVILSVGHLSHIKRFDRAIEIAQRILPSHPDWTWVICGEGPEREHLEQLISAAGLEDRVLLPGVIKDMDEQYRRAAIYVMTSETEGLPMVLLEAKSWGVPIVSFDIMTGPSDIVTSGVNGELISPFDLDAMTDKLSLLMDNPALRNDYSNKSQFDIDNFSFERIVRVWNDLLERC